MINVEVNGTNVRALCDSGASLCVVNKNLVNALNLSINKVHTGSIAVADGQKVPIVGTVQLNLKIANNNMTLDAVYVPQLTYDLVVGTNVLRHIAATIADGNGRLIWPTEEERGRRSQMVTSHLVVSVERVIIPPLSGMFVRSKVRGDQNGAFMIEPSKRVGADKIVPRGVYVVKDNHTEVFVTNTSRSHSLVVPLNMAFGRAHDSVRTWCDESGEVLALNLVNQAIRSPASASDVCPSSTDESDQDLPNRATRRALVLEQQKCQKVWHRVHGASMHSVNLIDATGKEHPGPSEKLTSEFDISPELTKEQHNRLVAFLNDHKDLFTIDLRTTTPLVTLDINTDGPPIKQAPYKLAHSEKSHVEKYILESLAAGLIRPSNSPWSSPILLVMKKDGTKRFCVDYRRLNAVTRKEVFPIPRVDDVLERLAGMRFFTTLDLVQSYYQVAVSENDKAKTAFITEQGSFEYNVMPFGLCNAPATFQRLMHLVLAGIHWQFCLVYIDDILIFSRSFDEHMMHLEQVFSRLRAAGLKLKPTKCKFAYAETVYLSHLISKDGVKPDPDKVAKIEKIDIDKWTDTTDVRAFLGITNYYRRFIQNYASVAAPLYNLTRQGVKFHVNHEVRSAFHELKRLLVTSPVLAYPRWDLPFILQVDASKKGMGGVLTQIINKVEHPIAYFSKKYTTSEEKGYSTTEQECLAMVEAIKHFRSYLYGQPFTVVTDHKPLEHLDSFKSHNGRVMRWRMMLADYNFNIVAGPGRDNANADALSRLPVVNLMTFQEDFADMTDPYKLRTQQLADPLIEHIINYLEKGVLPDTDEADRIVKLADSCYIKNGVLIQCLLSLSTQ